MHTPSRDLKYSISNNAIFFSFLLFGQPALHLVFSSINELFQGGIDDFGTKTEFLRS